MFGLFRPKKSAEEAGRTITESLALVMPYNQDQLERTLFSIDGVVGADQDWRAEIPFAFNAMALCSLMGHPAQDRIVSSMVEALSRLHPECMFVDTASSSSTRLALEAAAALMKAKISSATNAEHGGACAFVDALDPDMGQRFRDRCDSSKVSAVARIAARPISATRGYLQECRIV